MRRGILAGLVAGLFSGSVFGAGFQLYTEGSAEALGQAGAISGRDNLVSLAWYNPSALAGTGKTAIMAGSTFVQLRSDFNSPYGNSSMSEDWRVIPHFYYIQPVSSNCTAMLSVNAPYGLITQWPNNWVGRGISTYSRLEAIYATPSVAYKINDRLRVAAGINVVYAEAELSSITNAVIDLEKTLAGDDIGYGCTASVHYQPLEHWAMGARYQSRVKLDMKGARVSPMK